MTQRQYEILRDDYKENVEEVEIEVDENYKPINPAIPDSWKSHKCYRCPECSKLHETEGEAIDCCLPFYSVQDDMDRD